MARSCCGFGDTADRHFSSEKVAKELRQYRRKGPGVTTRRLRDGLIGAGLTRGTVLDIGGGFGALSLALLDSGMEHAVIVDASSAYLAAASEEAARRKRSSVTQFVHGDFVAVAGDLAAATVVALDRVVCCYPAYRSLLEKSLERAERGLALSYPRDRWHVRLGMWCENALRRRRGNPFRTFVHPPAELERMIETAGFRLASRAQTMTWAVDVFVRNGDRLAPPSRT
jgi:magnesium-protoporphyrin O-methyltransferase